MMVRVLGVVLAAWLAAANPAPAQASFVNRVWVVVESRQVALGELRVFLSEGTLVMASPHGTPAFGRWRQQDGRLTITEDGREYEVAILEASENGLRIRIHGPGEPVDIRFAPAVEGRIPLPPGPAGGTSAARLTGTKWRLEDLAGAGAIDGAQATLEFPDEGTVRGNGSCNRFHGTVTVKGDALTVGALAATRMACVEAVMRQEGDYFAALGGAERFELEGASLRIFTAGRTQPLRFVRAEEPEGRAQ